MNETTLKALRGSIAKWQSIVNGEGVDMGIRNCALCVLFFKHGCIGCPVMESTGSTCCDSTPYDDWCHYFDRRIGSCVGAGVIDEETILIAQAELNFLRSLLPNDWDAKNKRRLDLIDRKYAQFEQLSVDEENELQQLQKLAGEERAKLTPDLPDALKKTII